MCVVDGGAVTQPTEPIPFVPPPPQQPTPRRSWFRRHAASTAAIAVAVVITAIAVGFGVTAARSDDSNWTAVSKAPTDTAPAAPSAATTPTSAPSGDASRAIIRAVLLGQSGSTWSARTRAGALVTVITTPETRFGLGSAGTASNRFRSGDDVVIVGAVANRTMTADWIFAARAARSDTSAAR